MRSKQDGGKKKNSRILHGRDEVTAVDGKKKEALHSLFTPTGEHCLISRSNPPAPNSLIRSLEKNADLHVIKDYVEENNNSFLEYLSNSTRGRFVQLKAKLLA